MRSRPPVISEMARRRFLSLNLSKARARRRPYPITVTVDQLVEIGNRQNWRCAISGDHLEFTRGGTYNNNNSNARSCSIDRIETTGPYSQDNIQLVTWQSNMAKGGMSMQELRQWVGRTYRRMFRRKE